MATYLREARKLLRENTGTVRHNQNGSRSVVVEAGDKRAIVTINDGDSLIATFGKKYD
jgi:hypothetical protein